MSLKSHIPAPNFIYKIVGAEMKFLTEIQTLTERNETNTGNKADVNVPMII